MERSGARKEGSGPRTARSASSSSRSAARASTSSAHASAAASRSFAVAALALQLCTAEETTPTPQPTNADGDADLVLGLPLGMLIVLIIIAAVCLCQICQTFGTKKKRQCVWEFCCLDGDAYAARRIASAHAEGKGKWNSGSKASGTAGASPMHRTEIRDPETL